MIAGEGRGRNGRSRRPVFEVNDTGVRVATDAMSDRKKDIPRNVAHMLWL